MTTIDQPRSPFAMPTLPWARQALAPHISATTIDYHYGRHLQGYINNLNNLVKDTEFETASLEQIIHQAHGPIFNNAAQAWNHTLYFMQFSPAPQTKPTGALAAAIDRDFGSLDAFVEQFTKSATGLFGSGWTWLVAKKATNDDLTTGSPTADKKLEIVNTSNAGNPLTDGKTPLMVIDVWEHAYYIDHFNLRADTIKAFWNVFDWRLAEQRFDAL
jgi:Fe-Mn family superoxide dismutase